MTDFLVEAGRQPIQMIASGQVAKVLAVLPGGGCLPQSEGCLELLCRETGSTYALLATLALDGPNFLLGGKVVASNGTVAKTVTELSIPKDLFSPRGPQVQAAFKKLFAQLDMGSLPETVPVPKVIEVKPEPLKVEIPVVEESGEGVSTGRVIGVVAGGVAVITAGIGAGFAYSVNSDRSALVGATDANGSVQPAFLPNAQAFDRNLPIAAAMFGVAGAAAVTAVIALLASGGGESSVSIAPVEGGAIVGMSGSF